MTYRTERAQGVTAYQRRENWTGLAESNDMIHIDDVRRARGTEEKEKS